MIKIDDKEIKMSGNLQSLTEDVVAISLALEHFFAELKVDNDKVKFLKLLHKLNEMEIGEKKCEYSIKRSEVYGNLEN